jgi:hypothetical protein
MALEEFDYLGFRFISAHDRVDTESPMGRAIRPASRLLRYTRACYEPAASIEARFNMRQIKAMR